MLPEAYMKVWWYISLRFIMISYLLDAHMYVGISRKRELSTHLFGDDNYKKVLGDLNSRLRT